MPTRFVSQHILRKAGVQDRQFLAELSGASAGVAGERGPAPHEVQMDALEEPQRDRVEPQLGPAGMERVDARENALVQCNRRPVSSKARRHRAFDRLELRGRFGRAEI